MTPITGNRDARAASKATSKVQRDLEARIAELGGDEERVDVLKRARTFKASWVELGEALAQVQRGDRWKRWGFASFEDYCRKELHVKPDTAHKLTGSYAFLHARAPQVLRRDGIAAPIPPLGSVDFWRRAEEAGEGTDESYQELRQAVLEEAAPPAALKRRYREVFFPTDEAQKGTRDQAAVLSTARRLAQLLSAADLGAQAPRALVESLEQKLGQLVQALSEPVARSDAGGASAEDAPF